MTADLPAGGARDGTKSGDRSSGDRSSGEGPERPRRWWRRPVFWVALILVIVWIGLAALELALGVVHARQGLHSVQNAKAQLSASAVVAAAPLSALSSAQAEFHKASDELGSPFLAPFTVLPVLGRQLRAVHSLASAAAQVSKIGVGSVGGLKQVLDEHHSGGPDRVTTLRRLATMAASTDNSLSQVNLGPSQALIGPVATSHNEFANDLSQVRGSLQHAAASASALAGILQGPQNYLVLMANNAEMRSGSGMFLEAAGLSTQSGQLQMGPTVATGSIGLAPGQVPVGGTLEARWGWLSPGADFRNLGLTPQFDVNGPLAAQMWQTRTGQKVDGVIAVDVEALKLFLTVTGPVTLDDGTVIDAGNVVQFALHDQYAGLSDIGSSAQASARTDLLGSLARATLSALQNRSLNLRSLANAMSAAASGRHVLVWSDQPSVESDWVRAGVAGELPSDSVLPALLNTGGNKLDQYVSMNASTGTTVRNGHTEATVSVDIANATPPGQSQYIAGPYPGLNSSYGEYLGLLAVNLPGYATDVGVLSGPQTIVKGAEGQTWVAVVPVRIPAGGSERVVFGFRVNSPHGSFVILPTARIPLVTWSAGTTRFTDSAPHRVSW